MNSTDLPAIAALAGSAIGGLTSLRSAWLTQHPPPDTVRTRGPAISFASILRPVTAMIGDRATSPPVPEGSF